MGSYRRDDGGAVDGSAVGRTAVEVIVVGAGVIGATIAWRLAASGRRVTLVDPRPASGASQVAGGMLAPVTEAWPGEESLLELGCAAIDRWPSFAARLRDLGHDPGLRTDGTLVVAVDAADRAELDILAGLLAAMGRPAEPLSGRQLRALEPGLATAVRSGLSAPGDFSVDNRKLLAALLAAGRQAGVTHLAESVTAVRSGEVDYADGATLSGDVVVIAAGAWSGRLHPALAEVIRPVKGEILRLRARPGSLPPPRHTVRGIVAGRHVYLVPRDDGGLVVGATQYEAGFEELPRVAGVRDLLADAEALLPGIADYALEECAAGLRPGSPDNLPVLGWLEPGVLAATGHGRNGILLAPITAEAVLDLLDGKPLTGPLGGPLSGPPARQRGAG